MGINLKKVSTRIKDLLIQKPHLRDSDKKLLATVWWHDCTSKGYNPNELTTRKFLHLLADGQLTTPESVRRSRAKLQEENEDLRGEKYYKRKKLAKEVQTELGYNV